MMATSAGIATAALQRAHMGKVYCDFSATAARIGGPPMCAAENGSARDSALTFASSGVTYQVS
jgi:hypothetical protein